MDKDDRSSLKGSSILIIGATGFIGRYLLSYMKGKGCSVIAGVRDLDVARQQLGEDVELMDVNGDPAKFVKTLERVDTVINMRARQFAGVRWTK